MPPNQLLKYILDIESVIKEIEVLRNIHENFDRFNNDWATVRALERDLQIIGEAVNKLMKMDPSIEITSRRKIVDLRNLLVHSYDSIDNGMLWSIVHKEIPLLKEEIKTLKGEA